MHLSVFTWKLRALYTGIVIVTVTGVGTETMALAQDAAPDPATHADGATPEGHIIYSRDVAYGSAIGPRAPGHAHTVNAGPTALILDSLATGLKPIGDDENASIVASTLLQSARNGGHATEGMSALSSMTGAGGSASSVSDIQSTATGGAMNRASGAIGGTLGSLRSVLGDSLTAASGGGQ